jgi:hypothetical protein|tara:strand:- start:836 stop:1243 length:408 start_codon:yes stop_codon:yes gene_type:complete
MADEETQTNVVQFPRKYVGVAPKVTNFDAMKLNKELQFADELTDGIMVSMIHNMDENDIEITDSGFIQDIAFLSEAIKATIYRDRGFTHPFQNLIELISNVSYDEETKKTHVGMDMELIRELSEDFTEDDGPEKA